jgi:hypothetical protein
MRRMTLAQLQSFVLVARLGSVKAAAAELQVTEPAVSVAVAALRKELADDLFVGEGRGIALTPGAGGLARWRARSSAWPSRRGARCTSRPARVSRCRSSRPDSSPSTSGR